MATKKTSTKKTSTLAKKSPAKKAGKSSAKMVTIYYHAVGQPVEQKKVPVGTTVAQLVTDLNIGGYVISVNSREVSPNSDLVLVEGDSVRVGQKTKGNQ